MLARIAMMAITTSSSMSVNAANLIFRFSFITFLVGCSQFGARTLDSPALVSTPIWPSLSKADANLFDSTLRGNVFGFFGEKSLKREIYTRSAGEKHAVFHENHA